MSRIRRYAAFALVVCGLVASAMLVTGSHSAASASAPVVYSSSAKTVTIYAGHCLHTHTRSVRTEKWSTKLGHFVLLARPSVTTSDTYACK